MAQPGMLPDGCRVAVRQLASAPELNGARADVLHYDVERQRYAIRFVHPSFKRKEILVKPSALELVYAVLPQNLADARSVLRRSSGRISFEDCSKRWGPAVGHALVATAAINQGEAIFTEAPFLIMSNPDGLEKWVRRWDCYFAMTSLAHGGRGEVLEAFQESDRGGDRVVESLVPDAEATLEHLWRASAVDEAVRERARSSGQFKTEARRVAEVFARWQTNQHELGGEGRRALYWLAPKVAHSCEPNVGWEDPDLETGLVELRALRAIAPGEVLGVNYMEEGFLRLPLNVRRSRLSEERKFLCVCERCRVEAGESVLLTGGQRSALSGLGRPLVEVIPDVPAAAPPRVQEVDPHPQATPSRSPRPGVVGQEPPPGANSFDEMD